MKNKMKKMKIIKMKWFTNLGLKSGNLFALLAIISVVLSSCNNDLEELSNETFETKTNNFSSYNTKTILAPVGGQAYEFPETAVFVNGKLITTKVKKGTGTYIPGTYTEILADEISYSSMLSIANYNVITGGVQFFELPDAILDKEVEFIVTPGFSGTPEELALATPAGREQWQTVKLNLKKGAGDRLAVYKTVNGKANIKVIKANAEGVAAPKEGYFKLRVLNLSGVDVTASTASGYKLPNGLNKVSSGNYSEYVEIPYGSFRFLFKDDTGTNLAQREAFVTKAGYKANAAYIPFLPLQEFSSGISINNPGIANGMLPYGSNTTLPYGGSEYIFDPAELPYYPGGIYTAIVYPKDNNRLLFTMVMDNLRNFSPQKNVGKITVVNGTTAPIQATVNGENFSLASGEFSLSQIVKSKSYSITSNHTNFQVDVTNGRNVYLFAIETGSGEKKWLEVNYPTSPSLTTNNTLFSQIYTRYINLSPDAGTVDFVYNNNTATGLAYTKRVGKEKWEGQNLAFSEILPFSGKGFLNEYKVFGQIEENPRDNAVSAKDVINIGVAKSLTNNFKDDAPGLVIETVPFKDSPFGTPANAAVYTILLVGKTAPTAPLNEKAKIIVHKHQF
jgi:hypothetical protein